MLSIYWGSTMAKPGSASMLERIRNAREQMWLASLSVMSGGSNQSVFDEAVVEFSTPQRRHLVKMTDEELAELMATEGADSYLHHLAASILRSRESWRTPARWALFLSALSFLISLAALANTLDVEL